MTQSSLQDYENWRLTATGTEHSIKYKLVHGYPIIVVSDNEEARASEKYIIRSRDWTTFLRICFPPFVQTGSGTVFDFNITPNRYMPGTEGLATKFATKTVTCEPFPNTFPVDPYLSDAEADDGTYTDYMLVTIEYESAKDEVDTNDPSTFLELSADAGGEFLTLPSRGQWTDSDSPKEEDMVQDINIPLTVVRPQVEWNVRWPKVARNFLPTLMNRSRILLGKINSEDMPELLDAGVGTVLFIGFSFMEQITWRDDTIERPPVEMNFKFVEKTIKVGYITWKDAEGGLVQRKQYDFFTKEYLMSPENIATTLALYPGATTVTSSTTTMGHNYFYRPAKGEWWPLYHLAPRNTENVYTVANLNNLWSPTKLDWEDNV